MRSIQVIWLVLMSWSWLIEFLAVIRIPFRKKTSFLFFFLTFLIIDGIKMMGHS